MEQQEQLLKEFQAFLVAKAAAKAAEDEAKAIEASNQFLASLTASPMKIGINNPLISKSKPKVTVKKCVKCTISYEATGPELKINICVNCHKDFEKFRSELKPKICPVPGCGLFIRYTLKDYIKGRMEPKNAVCGKCYDKNRCHSSSNCENLATYDFLLRRFGKFCDLHYR